MMDKEVRSCYAFYGIKVIKASTKPKKKMKSILLLVASIAALGVPMLEPASAMNNGAFLHMDSGVAQFTFNRQNGDLFDSQATMRGGLLASGSLNSISDPDTQDCSVLAGTSTPCTATSGSTPSCSTWGGNRCSVGADSDGGQASCSTIAVVNAECSVGKDLSGRTGTGFCSAAADNGTFGGVRCSTDNASGGQSCSSHVSGTCSVKQAAGGLGAGCSVGDKSASTNKCSSYGAGSFCSVTAGSTGGGFCSVEESGVGGGCTVQDGGDCSVQVGGTGDCSVLGADPQPAVCQ